MAEQSNGQFNKTDTLAKKPDALRIALPSDGEMYEPTLAFFKACGIAAERPNSRRYVGTVPAIPGVAVLFQRTADITQKVEEGSADLGITGLDRYLEYRVETGQARVVMDDLGYGRCDLVLAVPDSWADVEDIHDLADLAVEFRQQGKSLRIATKYPRLVQRHLYAQGVNYFTLVATSGSLEAAPAAGYADIIGDLTASGTTLRENSLHPLEGGTILSSQGCLLANKERLAANKSRLELARQVLERMEAYLRGAKYVSITANIQGKTAEAVAKHVLDRPEVAGLQGPTVSRVFTPEGTGWFAVTVVVPKSRIQEVVDHLRRMGGSGVTVSQAGYLFAEESRAYRHLVDVLHEK